MLDERVGQVDYHLKTLAKGEILRPSGAPRGAPDGQHGWALGVEPDWLRVVLEIWAEAEVAG